MAKTRQDKIDKITEQIAQLENQRKLEQQRLKEEERKARVKRFCSRHGLLESMLPETATLTEEQFKTFLEKAVANDYGRRMLASIVTQGGNKSTDKQTTPQPQNSENTTLKATGTEHANAKTPSTQKVNGTTE